MASVSFRDTVKWVQIKHSARRVTAISADLVPRLRRILLRLEGAARLGNMAVPGYHLHPLKGDKRGLWSGRVSG